MKKLLLLLLLTLGFIGLAHAISSPEVCPVGYSTLAETMKFAWKPHPMKSGDVANIAFSPSNPNIVYLGSEVNVHSLYKSTDGGRKWHKIHIFDHAKDLAVHPNNPDVVFLNDSRDVRRRNDSRDLTNRQLLKWSTETRMVWII